MPDLDVRRLTSRNRPREVPPSAVEERVAFLDDQGNPADRGVASRVVATFYDARGNPVYTIRGDLRTASR